MHTAFFPDTALKAEPLPDQKKEQPSLLPRTVQPYIYKQANSPLLVSIPHAGTYVPDHVLQRMTTEARELPDTDWHVDRLYNFAESMNLSIIQANYSRYVIDVNRPPDDASLYPGRTTTGLCPNRLFNGNPIYHHSREPDDEEISRRINKIWVPYHDALQQGIRQNLARFGYALLYEAHSIRSTVPLLFDGRLPDLNLGTADGNSASPDLQDRLFEICKTASDCTAVLNGRFKGGYITRHYGDPDKGVHAVQLELTQYCYMNEVYPYNYIPGNASKIRIILKQLLDTMLAWEPS